MDDPSVFNDEVDTKDKDDAHTWAPQWWYWQRCPRCSPSCLSPGSPAPPCHWEKTKKCTYKNSLSFRVEYRQRVLNDLQRTKLFLAVVWFGSSPTPSPLSRQQLSDGRVFLSLCVAGRAYWRNRGEGVDVETNHTIARKPGPLEIIQYSLKYSIGMLQYIRAMSFLVFWKFILKLFTK
jgi:hypothetical protein